MKIINEPPPQKLLDAIRAAGMDPDLSKTFFTYGDIIYNPGGVEIQPSVLEHEEVHCDQQKSYQGGVDGWWGRYLVDPLFRVQQEAEAYGMQYRFLCAHHKDRNRRVRILMELAAMLAGPMYGRTINRQAAGDLIKKHAKV